VPGGSSSLTIPIAIVIAGALLGTGIYLGLRGDQKSARVALDPAANGASTAPSPRPAVSEEALTKEVVSALEGSRATLRTTCWEPAAQVRPTPAQARLTFEFTFAADGTQIGRGVREDRHASRPDVTACVLALLPPIRVQPPGANARVEVSFALP